MDFEQAVKAFKQKKNARTQQEEKREAYKKMIKEFTKLKYGYNKAGERVERPITQERIERREESKNRVIPDASEGLADFFRDAD